MKTRRSSPVARAAASAVERLEERRLFAASVVSAIPAAVGGVGAVTTLDLNPYFADSNSTVVKFSTQLGDFRVRLFDTQKPATVANFLEYVNGANGKESISGTLVHRVDVLGADPTPDGQQITTAPEIIQGGGYKLPNFDRITTGPAIVNEAATNGVVSNTRGTIAMARTSEPNSATSEWFINTTDNPGLDPGGFSPAGYAVFGEVVESDMLVVDAVGGVPRYPFGSPFNRIPLRDYTQGDFNKQKLPSDKNVVTTNVAVTNDIMASFAVTSSNPTVVAASVVDGKVVLTNGAQEGTATISVTATTFDGATATSSFEATVVPFEVQIGGASGNKALTYTDADGTVSTLAVKGAGTATVRLTGTDLTSTTKNGKVVVSGTNAALALVSLAGTDASTKVAINSRGGDGASTLDTISSNGAVKSIVAKSTTLTGGMTTVGAVGSVVLASASGATLTLGGVASDGGVSIKAGAMTDTDVISGSPIKALKVASFTGADAEDDVVTAPGIDTIASAGDFSGRVSAPGEGGIRSVKVGGNFTGTLNAHHVYAVAVKGDVAGATITAFHEANEHASAAVANQKQNQSINSLKVGRTITGSVIETGGSVGLVRAASITGSRIFAGLLGEAALPTVLAQLTQEATLNNVKIGAFTDSNIAARYLGKIAPGVVATGNGGTVHGIAGDTLAQLTASTPAGQKFSLKKIQSQADADAGLTGVTLEDFVVRIL